MALRRQRGEDPGKLQVSHGYIVRHCLKRKAANVTTKSCVMAHAYNNPAIKRLGRRTAVFAASLSYIGSSRQTLSKESDKTKWIHEYLK